MTADEEEELPAVPQLEWSMSHVDYYCSDNFGLGNLVFHYERKWADLVSTIMHANTLPTSTRSDSHYFYLLCAPGPIRDGSARRVVV